MPAKSILTSTLHIACSALLLLSAIMFVPCTSPAQGWCYGDGDEDNVCMAGADEDGAWCCDLYGCIPYNGYDPEIILNDAGCYPTE